MNCIDILKLLRVFGTKGIEKCEVYGKIKRQLNRPENLFQSINLDGDGIFVEVEVFALGLKHFEQYLKGNGYYNKDGIYMVNGSLIAFVNQVNLKFDDWYQLRGTLRFGTREINSNYVCLFGFYREDDKWNMPAYIAYPFDITDWDRHSDYYSWMLESSRLNEVTHPKEVNDLRKFTHKLEERLIIKQDNYNDEYDNIDESRNLSDFKLNKRNRVEICDKSAKFDELNDKLLNTKLVKEKFIANLVEDYGFKNNTDKYVEKLVNGLNKYFRRKPVSQGLTGRAILNKYLSNFKSHNKSYMGTKVGKYLIDNFSSISNYILDVSLDNNCTGIANNLCEVAFGNRNNLYAGVVAIILGFSVDEMLNVVANCEDNCLDFIYVVNNNPYILQFVSDLSFNDIERIALCFNKHLDTSLDIYRNISLVNDYISSTENSDTVFTKDGIARSNVGVRLTKFKYDSMIKSGSYLNIGVYMNIITYLCEHESREVLSYESSSFRKIGNEYIRKLSGVEVIKAISDYEKSGFGVCFDNYVTSTTLLDKELFIYDFMYRIGSKKFDYDNDLIDKYINEYEGIVGFKLEKEQRDSVHLINNSGFIVTGGAGSGKTTVSRCIIYVLERLEPTLKLEFTAPTGKAAKRMQEVIQRDVKTLHSRFKIGMKTSSLGDSSDFNANYGDFCLMIDESSMINLNLMYSVLSKLDLDSVRIVLIGDANQLSPIGKGLPFINLLKFMPCQFLAVSKRAVEGSNITLSSDIINNFSENDNWKDLESKDDFFLMNCRSEDITRVVYDLCAYYLGRKTSDQVSYMCKFLGIDKLPCIDNLIPDDIQVVSPLAKESYNWGTKSLNKLLQPVFNSTNGFSNTFIYQITESISGTKFLINDRVVHCDKNMYSMQWYGSVDSGVLQKIYGQGICNGEVGKIVGLMPTEYCTILDEIEDKPCNFEYTDNLRDDSSWYGEDRWLIFVEYYDYISKRNIYIAYRAEVNLNIESNEGMVFKGDDLKLLNLFYAGTTHKLQGSQNKLIICPLDYVGYNGFITRQMVYTMITRGEKLVFVVGSVGNSNVSMLTKARKDIASVDIKTIGNMLI